MSPASSAPSSHAQAPALSDCAIIPMADVLYSRWTTPILWVLQHHGPQRFTEIRRHLGTVTAKVLTQRLRHLERDGLIHHAVTGSVPPRSDYSITALGLSLNPAFRELAAWSTTNLHLVEQARQDYDTSGNRRPA